MKLSAVVATDNFGEPPVKKIAKRKSFQADVNCQIRTTTKGQANAIGFEDLVAIEDYSFMQSIAEGTKFGQSFKEAVDVVSVQQALINSWSSRTWERVKDLSL